MHRRYIKTLLMCGLFAVVAFCASLPADEEATGCDCDYCDAEEAIDSEEKEANATTPASQMMYKEDADGDGNRTICARDPDFNDREFPSVCHMLCNNRCTRFRMSLIVEKNGMENIVAIATRPNFYKLSDGPCKGNV